MEILLVLIPLSALVVVAAVVVFFRAVDSGQFDDLERQGRTALFDESGDRAGVATSNKPIKTD